MTSQITVKGAIRSHHYVHITAWKPIQGLCALFGFGQWLFESVGKGYPRLLQARSPGKSNFFSFFHGGGDDFGSAGRKCALFSQSGLDCGVLISRRGVVLRAPLILIKTREMLSSLDVKLAPGWLSGSAPGLLALDTNLAAV